MDWNSTQDIKKAFIKLHSKLKTFEDDPYESRAFLYLDIISWLESNIQNKPIGEIIKNKYSLNIGRWFYQIHKSALQYYFFFSQLNLSYTFEP